MNNTEQKNILQEIHPFIKEILLECGSIAKDFRKKGIDYELKADGTKVTKADLAVQHFILNKLTSKYPDFRITAEEILDGEFSSINHKNEKCDFRWIIDPIDGTSMFANPKENFYGHAIALMYKNDAIFSAFYSPEYELEEYKSSKWSGCFFEASELEDGILLNEKNRALDKDKNDFKDRRIVLDRVHSDKLNTKDLKVEFKSRSASLCLSLMAGGIDDSLVVFSNGDAAIWDVIPGNYFIRKSGGICVDSNLKDIFPLSNEKEEVKLKGSMKKIVVSGEYFSGYPNAVRKLLDFQ